MRAVATEGRKVALLRPLSQPEEVRAVRKPFVRYIRRLKIRVHGVPKGGLWGLTARSRAMSAIREGSTRAAKTRRLRVAAEHDTLNRLICYGETSEKHSMQQGFPAENELGDNGAPGIYNIANYVNGGRILRKKMADNPQDYPHIVDVAKRDDSGDRLVHNYEPLLSERSTDATEIPSKAQREDLGHVELTSLLDAFRAPMSKPHNTTTRARASMTTPRSFRNMYPSLQKSAHRPTFNQIRMSDSRRLAYLGPLLSTSTGMAANRRHTTAAVSENINAFGVSSIKALHRVRLCRLMPQSTHPLSENIQMGLSKEDL